MSAASPTGAAARYPRTAARAHHLLAASARRSFDPFQVIDWEQPIDDTAFHLAPDTLPLYGTRLWDAMNERERFRYSRHECAALCGAGIWFENILMHCVIGHLYDMPADDGAHHYLLVETADECRHSSMFGEYIRRAGTPAYRPSLALRRAGRFMKAAVTRPGAYVAILVAEEILDASNRATMAHEGVHPVSAAMARIHVIEEARHIAFARTYLEECWPRLDAATQGAAIAMAPFVARGIVDALVNPAVYETLGIERGYAEARRNRRHAARVRRELAPLAGFLAEVGVLPRAARPLWYALGLL